VHGTRERVGGSVRAGRDLDVASARESFRRDGFSWKSRNTSILRDSQLSIAQFTENVKHERDYRLDSQQNHVRRVRRQGVDAREGSGRLSVSVSCFSSPGIAQRLSFMWGQVVQPVAAVCTPKGECLAAAVRLRGGSGCSTGKCQRRSIGLRCGAPGLEWREAARGERRQQGLVG
jgi:hypothetical protein